jgi:hypothetical protein
MARFVGECVCFAIGLGALAEVFLPEHHNLEAFNYTLSEKVSRHPMAAGVALVAWGIVAFLTIRKLPRTGEKQGTIQ